MKIVLWGINYAPEPVGIAPFNRDLCEYLAAAGHDVAAVTSFPYYPAWRKAPGDAGRWHRAETVAGVRVHRCWCYVPAVATAARRIVHELTFGLVSMIRILRLPRAELYVVVSPPLVLGFFAWIASRLKRSRFVFHVQDLQPDAALGLGMLRRGPLVRALFGLERLAYAKAAAVSGISEGMMAAFREKGVPAARRALLPNWLRGGPETEPAAAERAAARRRFGVGAGTRLAVYAGNLGRKQKLEILVEAAALLDGQAPSGDRGTHVLIAGDGAARADLEACRRAHPGAAVTLLPLLSDADYRALLLAADYALITQAAGSGQFFFPSKLLSVLAAGLPVVAVADADSELALAVAAGGFGCTVPPGDAPALAAVWRRLAAGDGTELAGWRERTRWVRRFARETVLPQFAAFLAAAGRDTGAVPAPAAAGYAPAAAGAPMPPSVFP